MRVRFYIKIGMVLILVSFAFPAIAEENSFYNLSGDWDAVYDSSLSGKVKDIIKITQEGNSFVGIRANGSRWVPKGEHAIKGTLCERMICNVAMRCQKNYPVSDDLHWSDGHGVITEMGKKMIIQSEMKTISGKFFVTVFLTKKM